jgi:hypothetical protein
MPLSISNSKPAPLFLREGACWNLRHSHCALEISGDYSLKHRSETFACVSR